MDGLEQQVFDSIEDHRELVVFVRGLAREKAEFWEEVCGPVPDTVVFPDIAGQG